MRLKMHKGWLLPFAGPPLFSMLMILAGGETARAQTQPDDMRAAIRSSMGSAAQRLQEQNQQLNEMAQSAQILTQDMGDNMPQALGDGIVLELQRLKALRLTYNVVVGIVGAEASFINGDTAISKGDLANLIQHTDQALVMLLNDLANHQTQRNQFAAGLDSAVNALILANPAKTDIYIGAKVRLKPPMLDQEVALLRAILTQLSINLNMWPG